MAKMERKLLRVNLSSGRCREEPIPEEILRGYVGGRGLGIKYLYDEVGPGVDPLGPDNKLLLLTGPLAGSGAQASSRWMAVTKSPLTGTYCRAVGGADFGAWLRFAGLDLIVLEGRAPEPVYLYIEGGRYQLREASTLWGENTAETQTILKVIHGPQTRVACIGPAGERLVRYAVIASDRRTASRGGVGTVMGAKNLKAVAINTKRRADLAHADLFGQLVKEQIEEIRNHPLFPSFSDMGTAMADYMNVIGVFPTRNFREGELEGFNKIGGEEYRKIKVKNNACYGCMVHCGNVFRVPSGPYAGATNEGPEYETMWAFTGSIGCADIGATVAADALCDDLGLDTISVGNAIGFAYELFEKGLLTAADTDGLELGYGHHEALLPLIRKTGLREGFGHLLGEGVLRAAAQIGKGAEAYAMHVKGLEIPGYEPRGAKAQGLNYATCIMGANHCMGYASQEIFDSPVPEKVDRFEEKGKGELTKWNQDLVTFCELGIFCTFVGGQGMTSKELASRLIAAATGFEEFSNVETLDQVVERVDTLERMFNVREGFGRKDDTLPARMLDEPLRKGLAEGQVVADLEAMLDEYYQARGWSKDGIPTAEKLRSLGLEAVLEAIGYPSQTSRC